MEQDPWNSSTKQGTLFHDYVFNPFVVLKLSASAQGSCTSETCTCETPCCWNAADEHAYSSHSLPLLSSELKEKGDSEVLYIKLVLKIFGPSVQNGVCGDLAHNLFNYLIIYGH